MRRITTTAIVTALLALVLVSAASARVPNGVQNWQNMDAGLQPRTTWISNQAFRLKNIYKGSLVGYGSRTFGVDMEWGDHGDWIASLPAGSGASTRAITQADHVALYNTMSKKYLAYGYENFGVDLVWSDTPRFEWQLAGTGKNRGLYNSTYHDYLQYGERTWGINLQWQGHEVADQAYTEPPDYQPAPVGPQVSYVTLNQALTPSAMKERFSGRLKFQTYHSAIVDQLQNTSQYPISFVGWKYPAPDHCSGIVMGQGKTLEGGVLAALTRDQQGPRTYYDIKSCGAAGGTGNGSLPLMRVTYHYVS
jgi:hypothetical protein